jgi:Skp family chaperone for outer membrane proteins
MKNSSASAPVRGSDLHGRFLKKIVLAFLLIITPLPAFAQAEAAIGILVVDMQRVQRDSEAAISVREQSDALRAELEQIIAERAQKISAEEASLAKERADLSEEEFAQRVRDFEKRVFANRDFAQRESGKLQRLLAQAGNTLRRRIAPILTEIMRERQAQLMLDTSQVVLSADSLDVTEEVLQRLNAVLPTLVLAPARVPE